MLTTFHAVVAHTVPPSPPCPKLLLVMLLDVVMVIAVVGMLAARLRRAIARYNRKYCVLGDRSRCHEVLSVFCLGKET